MALEGVQAAPDDEAEIGTRVETTLRDYLEAWGEGTFSAPNEDAELRRVCLAPRPLLSAGGALRSPAEDGNPTPSYPLRPRAAEGATWGHRGALSRRTELEWRLRPPLRELCGCGEAQLRPHAPCSGATAGLSRRRSRVRVPSLPSKTSC